MKKCNHKYWNPYPDLMLCHVCGDSFLNSKKYGTYESLHRIVHPTSDNVVIRITVDEDNKPKFDFGL